MARNGIAMTARAGPAPASGAERRPRVLLVDDDERNLLALSEVLEPIATVVTATSGRTALRELLKDEFAVILLDVFMPEMDGPSLLREWLSRDPNMKFSFVSGYAEEAFAKNLPSDQQYNFLAKPFTLKQLVAEVKKTLAG